jgi:hypothetical protein
VDASGRFSNPDFPSEGGSGLRMPGEDPTRVLAQDEFEVPGIFEPCQDWNSIDGYCFNTSRAILHTRSNNSKQLICGNGHTLLHEGKVNIPAFQFADGGAFANVLPAELTPRASTVKKSRWAVPRAALARLDEFTSCARCRAEEFQAYGNKDTQLLWAWLSEWAPELVAAVHAELRSKPGAKLQDWFLHASVSLRTRIVTRVEMSLLQIDHGIPKKTGDELWPFLTSDERNFLQQLLLFKLCRRCNGAKSAKLLPRDELVRMYSETLYGSFAAAQADPIRWLILQRVLDKAYEQRALG